jgi:hypothetical protein
MQSMTTGKLAAAGIAGTTGAGSMAVLVEALARITTSRAAPGGMWAAMAVLITVTTVMACLGLILDHLQRRLEIGLEKSRQEMYRAVLEKSAGEPGSMASYRELILSDALHLAVERNGGWAVGRPPCGPGRPGSRRGSQSGVSCPGTRCHDDVTDEPSRRH